MKKIILSILVLFLLTTPSYAGEYMYEIKDGDAFFDNYLGVGHPNPHDYQAVIEHGPYADLETFEVLEQRYYAKDKNHVYAGPYTLEEADVETFELIQLDDQYNWGSIMDRGFAKDKNHVYSGLTILEGADPATFRLMPDYSTDGEYIYSNRTRKIALKELDAATFKSIGKNRVMDKTGIYSINQGDGELQKLIFSDILLSNNLYEPTKTAYEQGWINGYPDGSFRANDKVNRAEFAKMLTLAFDKGEGSESDLKNFPDVYFDQWYIPFLSKAVELGMMQGYPDGTMKPGNTINRAEALKMTLELIGKKEQVDYEAEWYEPYRLYAVRYMNVPLSKPETMGWDMTRGECVELILEAMNHMEQE